MISCKFWIKFLSSLQILQVLSGDHDEIPSTCLSTSDVMSMSDSEEVDTNNYGSDETNIRSHLALAMMGVDDDTTSQCSVVDIPHSNKYLEEYLEGRFSRSASFEDWPPNWLQIRGCQSSWELPVWLFSSASRSCRGCSSLIHEVIEVSCGLSRPKRWFREPLPLPVAVVAAVPRWQKSRVSVLVQRGGLDSLAGQSLLFWQPYQLVLLVR